MDWREITEQLQRKLDPAHVKPPAKYGPKGDYIEGWHAIAEANRIFGFNGWSYECLDLRCVSERDRAIGQAQKPGFGVTYTARVRVTVDGVQRDDVGAGHGYDVDCGLAHESAIKEAVTDALKRALRTFGNPFGLALYDKTREGVGHDAPKFNAPATLSRILKAIASRDTKDDLMALWKQETDALGALKDADPQAFQSAKDAFAKRGEEMASAGRPKQPLADDPLPPI